MRINVEILFCLVSMRSPNISYCSLFFFNDPATTKIYTLSLHDALPISLRCCSRLSGCFQRLKKTAIGTRSEEHTSELQSRPHLVCRLLLEKKKQKIKTTIRSYF